MVGYDTLRFKETLNCTLLEQSIINEIKKANCCNVDSDCDITYFGHSSVIGGEKQCYALVNKNSDLRKIENLIMKYEVKCQKCLHDCVLSYEGLVCKSLGSLVCEDKKCVIKEELCTGNLEGCVNQNITLEGNLATTTVYQHFLPSDIPPQYENIAYLDIKEYGQIILLLKEEINCENNIKIYGLLEKETIECGPEVVGKCPAEEYIVYVHQWECLE